MIRNNCWVCPYHEEEVIEMVVINTDYDQDGYSRVIWECPVCKAVTVVTNYPPEVENV